MAVTSSDSASDSGGSSPGRRCASIVLPIPGGPVNIRWCAPAAASSTAKRACGSQLDCEARLRLADHVGQFRPVVGFAGIRAGAPLELARAVEPGLHLPQRAGSVNVNAVHQRGLREIFYRHNHGRPALAFRRDHR